MQQSVTSSDSPVSILVLGAGFGGLYMARKLAAKIKHISRNVTITLLDQHNYFLFSPLLHEVIVEMVEMHHVVHPVRHTLQGLSVRFHETPILKIELENKTVITGMGNFSYDYLVIALGSVTQYFGMEDVRRNSFELKNISHAVRLRNHILSMLESASNTSDMDEQKRLLTFVQIGAGYTGLETITEIRDFIHNCLRHDYQEIDKSLLRFILVDALPTLPIPMHQYLTNSTIAHLNSKGISLKLNTPVHKAGRGWVEFNNGEVISTSTLIWTAGVVAHPVLADLPVEKGSMQRLKATDTLQLPAYPEVFTLGDCALVTADDNKPLPPSAQVVNQQASLVANNLSSILQGLPIRKFRFKHLGELASLGEFNAIAELGPLRLSGFLAWWIWRTIYLFKMPWWNDRVQIAIDWTLDLIMRRNTARIDFGQSCPQCMAFPTLEEKKAAVSTIDITATPDNITDAASQTSSFDL